MKKGPLRIAIVGCGQFAEAHIQEIQKIEISKVVAVCDLEKLMAEQLAERYNIPAFYDDIDKLFNEIEPDVVHITTPPQSHYSLALKALSRGCHAYVEKPFAMNFQETDEIINEAEKVGKNVTIGHSYFFEPTALMVRRLVSEGKLGELIHVESFYGYNLSGPFGSGILGNKNHWVHKLPGKLFHNNIDHLMNKVMEFIPDERPEVFAKGYATRLGMQGDDRDKMFNELRVMIIGAQTTGYATFSCHTKPVGHFTRIYGSKSTIHVDYVARTIVQENGQKYPSAVGRLLPAFDMGLQYLREGKRNVGRFLKNDFHFFSGMNKLISLFYESIIYGTPVPISYKEIRRMSAINEMIFSQVKQD
jgi:predicted dehydrogenase